MQVFLCVSSALINFEQKLFFASISLKAAIISFSLPVFLAWEPSVKKDMKFELARIASHFSFTASAMKLMNSLAALVS